MAVAREFMAPGGLEAHGQEATEVVDTEAGATEAATDLAGRAGATGAPPTGAAVTVEASPGATGTDRGAP